MVNIQPVVFPVVGTATKLGISILTFATDAKFCTVIYQLLTEQNQRIIDGNYQLTEQEFAAWGVDNSYIDNIVAAYLGVVIIPKLTDDEEVDNGGDGIQGVTIDHPDFLNN